MKWFRALIAAVILSNLPLGVMAGSARILKVLPHLLDKEGRHALSPSLFERDAYQAKLRKNPQEISALRYDVQWRGAAPDSGPLKLRLLLRSDSTKPEAPTVIETPVNPPRFVSRWSGVVIPAETYLALGHIIAWKIELVSGDQVLAQQSSFLW